MTKSIKDGFIKVCRQHLEDPDIFDGPSRLMLWILIIKMAKFDNLYYKDKTFGVEVRKGQLVTTTRKLGKIVGVSHTTIVRWLQEFEERGYITMKTIEIPNANLIRKATLITVIFLAD